MTQATNTDTTSEKFKEATSAEIDDADIAKDRAALRVWAAARSQELIATATPEAIRNFAHGYGDDNPLYTDPDYGRATRWGGQIAPQIMAAVLNAPLRGDKLPKELRGGSYRGIHAFVSGGTWEWYRPVYPGDTLYSFSGLESVEEKTSDFAGRSVIRVLRDVKMNQHAEVVGVYRTLVIYTERKKAREKGKYSAIEDPSYTKEDIAALDEIYAAEKVRGAEPRYWEDVVVGEEMGTMAKGPLTTTDMVVFHAGGYGFVPYGLKTGRLAYQNRRRIPAFYIDNEYGVPDVAQRVHWDSEWAKAIGNPRAYDYGVLRECWIHHFLTDWMGDGGFVVRQHDEIRKFNYQGDIQYLTGKVDGKRQEDGLMLIDVAVEVQNQRGDTTAQADATISLPSRELGAAMLPDAPKDLQRDAVRIFERHGELLKSNNA
ncbi:FAS1-like dehydratase domain-containing protein [Mycobacterium paraseoulense]|uniref:Acyl dehydratase n=1 Tax=Mycobacterium paraseoulense TaxID=590652 RepID=A0A1X0IG51_9MYCO|nr:MaoC family dehydratase N-terminal domain-containing protein [Mycobacterium paraseoulense]MCV7393722.1 MaoC family dehydratase N-terminal domain-containing protein [Mycobacterium paraseoulense]ORB45527.1 acyl dehydratase [Mycobacterium paraseoulense]BBZ70660.1 acyl dehydratase [Mycobacterium paraseoulense]